MIIKNKTKWLFLFGLTALAFFDTYQYFEIRSLATKIYPELPNINKIKNDTQLTSEIEKYLDFISPSLTPAIKSLATKNNLPSWGCGPSSYALAETINKKFFDSKLRIDAAYNNQPYEIVERFGFATAKDHSVVDHAWLEIYLGNVFLFIDPTVGQFGKINGIAYHVFKVGDSNIPKVLLNEYGIVDERLSLLVNKAVNRVPVDQSPYPGVAIDPKYVQYYLLVLQDRNTVDQGQVPDNWKDFIKILAQTSDLYVNF